MSVSGVGERGVETEQPMYCSLFCIHLAILGIMS